MHASGKKPRCGSAEAVEVEDILKIMSRFIAGMRAASLPFAGLLFLGGTGFLAPYNAAYGAFQQDAQGLVSMEAESFATSVPQGGHQWQLENNPIAGYSGSGTVRALPEDSVNQKTDYSANSPRLDFPVQFTGSGTHYLWIRALGPSAGSNSVHLGLNGQEIPTAAAIGYADRSGYVWAGGTQTVVVPSAGLHTLNLWMRESGSIVDKIVVTSDPGFLPSGSGPVESPQAGGSVNVPPVLASIGSREVTEGSTLAFTVTASDGDGLPPLLTVSGLPTGASFTDQGSGVGSFSWPTVAGNAGVYTVTFRATDAVDTALSDSELVAITVDSSSGGGASGAFQQSAQGLVSVEAESFTFSLAQGGHQWQPETNPASGYSGAGTVRALPEDGVNIASGYAGSSPRLDFDIEFNQGGTHYVWLRAAGPSGGSNSVHGGLDGLEVPTAAGISIAPKAGYVWTSGADTITVSAAGVHTLNLWMRESGSIVDKVVLTTDPTFVPTGSGPGESPIGTGGGSGTNQAPVLTPVGSKSAIEGGTLSFAVTASDADGQAPLVAASGLPNGATFTGGTNGSGSFSWPQVGSAGTYTVTFTAIDAVDANLTDSEQVTISVAPTSGGGGGTGAFQQNSEGLVSVEAESFAASVSQGGHQWQPESSPTAGFSGSGAMRALPEDSVNQKTNYAANSPRLDFPIAFNRSGTHYLWVRALGSNASSNSLHLGLNGQEVSTAGNIGYADRAGYVWTSGSNTVVVPSTGVHTINLWMRESGSIIDKIVVTSDPGFVPTGSGPSESPIDGGSGGGGGQLPIEENFDDGSAQGWVVVNDTGAAADWSVVPEGGGNQAYFQFNGVQSSALDGSYRRGTMSYLGTASSLTDFRFQVEITPLAAEGDDVGVVFRYQSSDAYYRLSLNAAYGFTRLEKKVNGNFVTLARDARGYIAERPMEIVVEAKGPLFQIYRDGDPIMAVRDSSLATGSVGLYTRDAARFDNVLVTANDTTPQVVISAPLAYSLYPNGPRNLSASAIALNLPSGAGVSFQLDGQPCGVSSQPQAGHFVATCASVQPGEHVLVALLRNAQSAELDRDTNVAVGVGLEAVSSNHYLALGDSITNGTSDNLERDNQSLDGRSIGTRGWAGVLGELLGASSGYPNLVVNEGVPSDRSDQLLIERLQGNLERNPLANKALILIGTNDSNNSVALPSGAGCSYSQPGDCNNTLKGNLLEIIGELPSGMEAIVSLLPPAFGEGAKTNPILDPLNNVQRTQRIRTYNQMIAQEVVTRPGIRLGADLFSCFLRAADGQGPAINRFSLFEDNLHPNGLGYRVFAHVLHDALSGSGVQPGDWCAAPTYILENLSPWTYKQNLLEVGDSFYIDESYTLTDVPAALTEAVWVMTANADRTKTATSALSVNLGNAPVTVYVAYDANAVAPGWLTTQGFGATSLEVRAAGGSVSRYRLYRATNRTGNLNLPGNRANGGTCAANYFLVVQ